MGNGRVYDRLKVTCGLPASVCVRVNPVAWHENRQATVSRFHSKYRWFNVRGTQSALKAVLVYCAQTTVYNAIDKLFVSAFECCYYQLQVWLVNCVCSLSETTLVCNAKKMVIRCANRVPNPPFVHTLRSYCHHAHENITCWRARWRALRSSRDHSRALLSLHRLSCPIENQNWNESFTVRFQS